MHDTNSAPGAAHAHVSPAHDQTAAAGATHDQERHDAAGRPRIAFVGAGHVGTALAVAFAGAGWPVTAVASRDEARRADFTARVAGSRGFAEPTAVLDDADLIFLTVPDDAVAAVAADLHLYSGQALVHTSGALPARVLGPAMAAGTSIGSFHPLVAFADLDRTLSALPGATIALEGDESLLPLLAELAESIGAKAVRLPAGTKTAYHAAAAMAAGGIVAILDAMAEVAAQSGFDEATALAIYLPLARQSLANAETLGVATALTGPVLRGDSGTLAEHLDFIRRHAPAALPLYKSLALRELAIAERRGALGAERVAELEALLRTAEDSV
jgi:predicted short-subunit dehydrogenase-like oxidoreductase (DUF2520 family)